MILSWNSVEQNSWNIFGRRWVVEHKELKLMTMDYSGLQVLFLRPACQTLYHPWSTAMTWIPVLEWHQKVYKHLYRSTYWILPCCKEKKKEKCWAVTEVANLVFYFFFKQNIFNAWKQHLQYSNFTYSNGRITGAEIFKFWPKKGFYAWFQIWECGRNIIYTSGRSDFP